MKKKGVTIKSGIKPQEENPLKKLPIEERLKLLNDVDKAYIRGYIDRALVEQRRKSPKKSGEKNAVKIRGSLNK